MTSSLCLVLIPDISVPQSARECGDVADTFLAVTKQLYEWFSLSVCLSVTPFWLCSHHLIITKFSGVITNDRSDVHAKGQGQSQMSMSQKS